MTDLLVLLIFIGAFCGALAFAGLAGRIAQRVNRRRRLAAEREAAHARWIARRAHEELCCTMAQEIMRSVNYPEYNPPLQPPRARAATTVQ